MHFTKWNKKSSSLGTCWLLGYILRKQRLQESDPFGWRRIRLSHGLCEHCRLLDERVNVTSSITPSLEGYRNTVTSPQGQIPVWWILLSFRHKTDNWDYIQLYCAIQTQCWRDVGSTNPCVLESLWAYRIIPVSLRWASQKTLKSLKMSIAFCLASV